MADQSILTSVKRTLGLAEDYEVFDQDVIMHINTALGTLNQLGVGPVEGYMIEDKSAMWSAFLGTNARLNPAKSYVYQRVRLLFDSSTLTGPVLDSIKESIKEFEWRLQVEADPDMPPVIIDDEDEEGDMADDHLLILDGGSP